MDFHDSVKEIIIEAKNQMLSFKHSYIGSEHLVLALLKKDEEIARIFKEQHKVTYASFKAKITEVLGYGDKKAGFMLYTPLLKRVLDTAINIAREEGLSLVDNITLLRAFAEEEEGVAFRVLLGLGVNADDIHHICDQVNEKKIEKEKEINGSLFKKEEIFVKYFYDCLVSFKHKDITELKKIPIFKISSEEFVILENQNVEPTEEFYEIIKEQCLILKEDSGRSNKQTAAIFVRDGVEREHIVINFQKKNKTLVSQAKCLLNSEDAEELYSIAQRLPLHTDKIIKSHKEGINKIFVTEVILTEVLEEQRKIMQAREIEKAKKQTRSKLEKLDCLVNLNTQVKRNNTVIIGFEEELEALTKGLLKMRKPNVIITGEPGVGKTALVEKLACAINEQMVPEYFWDKEIYQLHMSNAVAGTKYRGEFEDKMKEILKEIEANPQIILFIDEIHTMVGAGGAEGAIDAANIFKPALARGSIKVIGATTNDEYKTSVEKDGALKRRFQRINVIEPSEAQVHRIMEGMRPVFENHYRVMISDAKLTEIYDRSKRMPGLMPDIALDELENWCVEKYYEAHTDSKEKVISNA